MAKIANIKTLWSNSDLLGRLVDVLYWIRERLTRRPVSPVVIAEPSQDGIAPTSN